MRSGVWSVRSGVWSVRSGVWSVREWCVECEGVMCGV